MTNAISLKTWISVVQIVMFLLQNEWMVMRQYWWGNVTVGGLAARNQKLLKPRSSLRNCCTFLSKDHFWSLVASVYKHTFTIISNETIHTLHLLFVLCNACTATVQSKQIPLGNRHNAWVHFLRTLPSLLPRQRVVVRRGMKGMNELLHISGWYRNSQGHVLPYLMHIKQMN